MKTKLITTGVYKAGYILQSFHKIPYFDIFMVIISFHCILQTMNMMYRWFNSLQMFWRGRHLWSWV